MNLIGLDWNVIVVWVWLNNWKLVCCGVYKNDLMMKFDLKCVDGFIELLVFYWKVFMV